MDAEARDTVVEPLAGLPAGATARVVRLGGGREFQSRLVSMGLTRGSELRVLRGSDRAGGPVLVALGGTRLAIGRGMAERIYVSPSRSQQAGGPGRPGLSPHGER